ncbi:MAG: glucosaminidase domain-containing protein [Desulfobulbaceae bacterium]|nr:glucosaminidase domain-containing protein [Desulfobulbaceae bacterium]
MKVCSQIKSISSGSLLKVPVDKVLGLSCSAIEWCFQKLTQSKKVLKLTLKLYNNNTLCICQQRFDDFWQNRQILSATTRSSVAVFSRQQVERFRLHSPLAGLIFCGILSAILWQQSQKNDVSSFIGSNIVLSSTRDHASATNNKSDLSHSSKAVPYSTNDLISRLKANGLWDLSGKTEITPLLLTGFPVNLQYLDVPSKKRAFFHTLLPIAKIALHEVEEERQQLLDIARKIPEDVKGLSDEFENGFSLYLPEKDSLLLSEMARKYRAEGMDDLLAKVDIFPVSLILAQGAIESSWGTSRFATQGNNIFGMWTWSGKGMIPAERQVGKTHKVAIYDSILDSVRDYILTLNRHEAHEEIRNIRLQSHDSVQLAEGLKNYSERRDAYVSDVQMMIDYNRLQNYDSLNLAGDPGQWFGASSS